jgi:hypothetical protein
VSHCRDLRRSWSYCYNHKQKLENLKEIEEKIKASGKNAEAIACHNGNLLI